MHGANSSALVICAGVYKFVDCHADASDRSVLDFVLPPHPAGDSTSPLRAVDACTILITTQCDDAAMFVFSQLIFGVLVVVFILVISLCSFRVHIHQHLPANECKSVLSKTCKLIRRRMYEPMFRSRVFMLHQRPNDLTAGSSVVQNRQTKVRVPANKELFTVPLVPFIPLCGIVATEHVILGTAYHALGIYLG